MLASFSGLLAEASIADTVHDCATLPEEEMLAAVLTGAPVPKRIREQLLVTSLASEPQAPVADTKRSPRRQRGRNAGPPAEMVDPPAASTAEVTQ